MAGKYARFVVVCGLFDVSANRVSAMISTLRILFAGTPEFAARALRHVLDDSHIQVLAVLTQPDRPAGRGLRVQESAVKRLAKQHHIEVLQPATLKSQETQELLAGYQADLMVVAAYGLILPRAVLELFPWGCINIHASLLPRWRGAAPIHRALWAGDTQTGICIMAMDEGLDTGSVYKSYPISIDAHDTTESLHDTLADLGGTALLEVLHQLPHLQAQVQEGEASYAAKIRKEEALICWEHAGQWIERQIRALNPSPVAWTALNGARLKIWQAKLPLVPPPMPPAALAGQIFEHVGAFYVCCGDATVLELLEVQLSGQKRLPAESFFARHPEWLQQVLNVT